MRYIISPNFPVLKKIYQIFPNFPGLKKRAIYMISPNFPALGKAPQVFPKLSRSGNKASQFPTNFQILKLTERTLPCTCCKKRPRTEARLRAGEPRALYLRDGSSLNSGSSDHCFIKNFSLWATLGWACNIRSSHF